MSVSDAEVNVGTEEVSWRELIGGPYSAISLVLAGGIALHAVNLTITATMLPSIVTDIGGQHLYSWTSSLATVAAIISAAITGKFMRWVGIKRSFALAGLLFSIGCLLAATAPDMFNLLAGRIVQGAGGGILFTLCYSMIVLLYPERLWPLALALLSGTWGVTMLFGPAIGGMFAQFDAWRLGFGAMLPATAVFVILVNVVLPNKEPTGTSGTKIAFIQLALLAASVLAVSIGGASHNPITSGVSLLGAGMLITVLVTRERAKEPKLFPTGAMNFDNPLFWAIAAMALLIVCINAEFFLPYFLQKVHGFQPISAGYLAALVSIGWAASEVISAKTRKQLVPTILLLGPCLICASSLTLAALIPLSHANTMFVVVLAVVLISLGAGIGVGWPHLNTMAFQFTSEKERDQAASAMSTVQMFAVAIGAAFSGFIGNLTGFQEYSNISRLQNSAFWMFLFFAAIALLALLAVRALLKRTLDSKMEP